MKTDTLKTMVTWVLTPKIGDFILSGTFGDTFYVAGDFVLESIKKISLQTSTNLGSASSSSYPVVKKIPINFSITNWRQQIGMVFDTSTTPHFTKAYSIKKGNKKNFGYPLTTDLAVLGNEEERRQAYISTGKDTLLNNQKYIVLTCKKLSDTLIFDNKPGVLQKAILLLDPRFKDRCFPFISKTICERFGGALVQAHYYFDQDRELHFEYSYRKGFTNKEDSLMNLFEQLYYANQASLDTVGHVK